MKFNILIANTVPVSIYLKYHYENNITNYFKNYKFRRDEKY